MTARSSLHGGFTVAVPAALAAVAILAVPAAFVGPTAARMLTIGVLALFGPGGAVADWIHHASTARRPDTAMLLSLAIAVSMATAALVSTVLLYAHRWHPAVVVMILAGITLALLGAPRLRRLIARPGTP